MNNAKSSDIADRKKSRAWRLCRALLIDRTTDIRNQSSLALIAGILRVSATKILDVQKRISRISKRIDLQYHLTGDLQFFKTNHRNPVNLASTRAGTQAEEMRFFAKKLYLPPEKFTFC